MRTVKNTQSNFFPWLLAVLAIWMSHAAIAQTGLLPSEIALGSSEHIWLVDDADSKILFRKNNATQRYDHIVSNIKVDALDVSQDGLVFALSSDDLYVWDDSGQKFIAHSSQQEFDQLSVGDNALWGVSSNNAYQWNASGNSFDKISSKIAFVAVGKQDDSVWAIDTSGELYQYDFNAQSFTALSSGGSKLVSLYVVDATSVWAINKQGAVLQWNSVEKRLVDVSAQINAAGLLSFAVDESNIFHAVTSLGLSVQNIERVQVDYSVASKVSNPVSAFAQDGTRHMIYNYNSQIYHAYTVAGSDESSKTWIGAKPIMDSRVGTDLNLSVDSAGVLHASWISGQGNAQEIHYVAGWKDPSNGGYGWSTVVQVSDDAVADSGLKMILNPSNEPVFLTSKRDQDAHHSEHDNYQHRLGDDQVIIFNDKLNLNSSYREDMLFPEQFGSLQNILLPTGELGSGNSFKMIPPGHSISVDFAAGGSRGISWQLSAGAAKQPDGIGMDIKLKLGAEIQPAPTSPSIGFTVTTDVAHAFYSSGEELDVNVALELEVGFPILTEVAPEAAPLLAAAETLQFKLDLEMLIDLGWEVAEFNIQRPEGSETELACTNVAPTQTVRLTKTLHLDSSVMPDFLQVAEKVAASAEAGAKYVIPPPKGTNPADLVYRFNIEAFTPFILDAVAASVGGAGLANPATPGGNLFGDNYVKGSSTQWSLGVGIDGKLKIPAGIGQIHGLFEVAALWDGQTGKTKTQETLLIETTIWHVTVDLLKLVFTQPDSSSLAGYKPGGSTAIHAPGLILGSDTASNTIDEGRIDVLKLDGGSVLGTFKQETGDADFEAIYIIDGAFDSRTGGIDWDVNSVKRLDGTGGFVADPLITSYTIDNKEHALIAWLGVPASDPDVQTVATTPAGKAYIIKPGTEDIDLSTVSQKTASANGNFYYSNDKALFGIGASVAALGDVDGNGKNDFIVGAPDAEMEAGRAYVVFGEKYNAQIDTDIDARQGALGLVLSGAVDSELGYAVSTAGDFNRDGKADFMVGSPGSNEVQGNTYVIYGGASLAQSTGIVDADKSALVGEIFSGQADSGQFGYSLAGGHDVSADGHDDLIIGALGENAVYVYTNPTDAPWKLTYNAENDKASLGGDVASVGDVNGDNVADLLLGTAGNGYLLFGGERLTDYANNTVVSWQIPATDGSGASPYQVVATFTGNDADNDGILRGRATSPDSAITDGHANELTNYRLEFFQDGKLVNTLGLADQKAIAKFNFNYAIASDQVLASEDWTQSDGVFAGDDDGWFIQSGDLIKPIGIIKQAKWTINNGYMLELEFLGTDEDGDGVIRGRAVNPQKLDGDYKNELTVWTLNFYQNETLLYTVDLNKQQTRGDFNFNYVVKNNTIDYGPDSSPSGFNAGIADGGYNFYSDGKTISIYDLEEDYTPQLVSAQPDFIIGNENMDATASPAGLMLVDASSVVAEAALSKNHFTKLSTPYSFAVTNINRIPQIGTVFENDTSGFVHVAAAGDINGDGVADMLLGYSDNKGLDYQPVPGQGYVVFGSGALTSQPTIALSDIEAQAQGALLAFGGTVAAAGDVNGDKVDDIIVFEASPAEGDAEGVIYYGQADAVPIVGPKISGASDPRELSGLSLAALGDLDGDGSSELLIGAPFGFDSSVITNIDAKAQIYQAAIPLTPGSSYQVSRFPVTDAKGVSLQDLEATGNSTVMTWIEQQADPDTQVASATLFAAIMTGGSWGNQQALRTSAAVINGVSISATSAVGSSQTVTPGMLWHETTAAGNSSLWQASYDNDAVNWTVAQSQLQASNTIVTLSYDDTDLTVGANSYQVMGASANENDGKVTVSVKRTGDLSKASSVSYRTVDGSAQQGQDYKHKNGEVHFSAGEKLKKISIHLLEDALPEKPEQVFIELSSKAVKAYRSRHGYRVSGIAITMGVVNIDDDDGDQVLELSAIDSGFILAGEKDSYLGGALAPAGNINNDKWDDFIVGAPAANDSLGRAYLVLGHSGIEVTDMDLDLDTINVDTNADHSASGILFTGTEAGARAGTAVAGGKTDQKRFVAISQLGKVYLFDWSYLKGKTTVSLDSSNPAIRVLKGESAVDGGLFGSYMVVADVDSNNYDDLIIIDPGADSGNGKGRVYIVYDKYINSTLSGPITAGTDVDIISNSLNTNFGSAIAVGDFNNDTLKDLVLGSPQANGIVKTGCTANGSGGFVYAVWGTGKGARLGDTDLNYLQGRGRIFEGIINIADSDASAPGDGDTGMVSSMPMLGNLYSDSVGDSAALLDFNGDGIDDLVIGAPTGSPIGDDGILTLEDTAAGRVYVLFGSDKWSTSDTPYQLGGLYSETYADGLVFEGITQSAHAGASVVNVGKFRGDTDTNKDEGDVEDLLIGAPNVGNNAGQSYVVFGSSNHYQIDTSQPNDHRNIQWLSPVGDPMHPKVPLLFAFQGLVNADSSDIEAGALGTVLASAGDINNDGANDILLAAPMLDLNDVSQLYVPIGHSWIQAGDSLNVKHLRSDNGFVIQNSGTPQGVDDFNRDGYDDFVIGGSNPELVLGGNTLSNLNGVRQYPLGIVNDGFHIMQALDNGYELKIFVNGIDADGDGVLRGRGSIPTTISGGYGNEVTKWNLHITHNGIVVYNIDWATQQQRTNFNFNFDLTSETVIVTDTWHTASGLNAGAVGAGLYNVLDGFNGSGGTNLLVQTQDAATNKTTVSNSVTRFETDSDPFPMFQVYRAIWNGSNGYKVMIDFGGVDADGDGILRGRAKGSQSVQPKMPNELTMYTMRVYSPQNILLDTWSYDNQINGTKVDPTWPKDKNGNYPRVSVEDFNLNYNLKTNTFLDALDSDQSHQTSTLNNSQLHLGSTDWRGGDHESGGPGVIYMFCGDCEYTSWKQLSLSNNNKGISKTGLSPNFNIKKAPAFTTGPIVAGDFNGDGGQDFVLFNNIAALTPATVGHPAIAPGLTAITYTANSDPAAAIASATGSTIPLQYISKVDSGDINGDGFADIVLSGYNVSDDKSYLYAYYGSQTGLDWSNPETIYAQTDGLIQNLLSLIDLNNDGQDDIVAYGLTIAAGYMPLPYDYQYCASSTLGSLFTYGADRVGSKSSAPQSIPLLDSIFSADVYKNLKIYDVCYLTASKPVDIDNDGLVDLNLHVGFTDGNELSSILRSTGNFSFDNGSSKWSTVAFSHPSTSNYDPRGPTTQSAFIHPNITGVGDFNHDGVDDVLMTNQGAVASNKTAAYSYVVYGSPDFWLHSGTVIALANQNDAFDMGMAIEGSAAISEGYLAAAAGDLNGDGFADIVMSNDDKIITYGLYGYRTETATTTDYIVGSDTGEPLVQQSSEKNTVNVQAKSGADTIQTARSLAGSSLTPYKIVVNAGPGDDSIGISTVDSTLIHRIDGGHGIDTLKINPDFSGSANTLDLTLISRRIRNIEMIDLGDDNGLSFSYLDVRNMSGNKNTLMIKGTHSYAKAIDGERWRKLEGAAGQAVRDNIVYTVYRYVPIDDSGKELDSNIQVWIQHGGVTWRPFLN